MIIADTGFFVALANRADRDHPCVAAFAATNRERLVTTWPVLTETCYLLLDGIGAHAVTLLLDAVARSEFTIFEGAGHASRMAELVRKYQDLPMDLADASLVVLAEATGSGRIVSTDRRDFRTYRFKNHRPFVNLLDLP